MENSSTSKSGSRSSVVSRKTVALLTTVVLAAMAYALTGRYLYDVQAETADHRRPEPIAFNKVTRLNQKAIPRNIEAPGVDPRSPTELRKPQDRDLLGKYWDKAVFDKFVERNMKPYSKDRPHDMGLTSYNMSKVELISHRRRSVQVGDILHFRIESRDFNGRHRLIGGDFWYALLNSAKNPKASTAGYIVDHENGTYDAFLLAAWPGKAQFNLILVHVSEAVHHVRSYVWNVERRVFFIGQFQVGNKTAKGSCYMQRRGEWKGKCDFPAYNSIGGTVFLCDYQPGFPCESLVFIMIDRNRISKSDTELRNGVEVFFERPFYWQEVRVPNSTLTIEGSNLPPIELPRCTADQEIPQIQGFWLNGKWNSLLCQFSDWTDQSKLHKCLHDREVIILGDSTTRQVRDNLVKAVKLKNKNVDKSLWSRTKFESINAQIYWQFHPYVLGSGTYKVADWKSEVDALNELNNTNCNYIVMIGQWAHFAQWTRDSYIERVRLIRRAVIGLRERCPDVPIVIQGPHARHPEGPLGSVGNPDCLHKEMELLNREAFAGTGAFFLPVWDLKLSAPSPNNVHMPPYVIREEIKMFLGYACDTIFSKGQ